VQKVLFKGPEAKVERKEDMMISYLRILRPSIIFLTAFAVLVSSFIVGFYQYQILVAVVVASLIAGAGNVTNDYFDYEIDKINKPKRVLPSGKMKRKNAIIYAAMLYAVADVLALVFLNYNMFLFAILNTGVAIIYAWKIKSTPFGHFLDSWLASSTFLFGSLLVGINATIIILFIMSYLGNFGREATKGIEDMEGDRKMGARTLAVVTGKVFTSWAAISFIIFAIIISFIPYVFHLLNIYYLGLIILSDMIFIYSCVLLMLNPKKSQKIMKLAMFVTLIAFLVGIL
jgi:geranylgeranylglycerol-phosphate geranylgeranyltransferase